MRIRLGQLSIVESCKFGLSNTNEAIARKWKSKWSDAARGSYEEVPMFTQMLIPLDGSKTAEKVLPYARFVAGALKLPLELLAVVDIVEMATHITAARASHMDTVIEDSVRNSEQYLRGVAGTFPGANTKCTVEKGKAEQVIIETAAAGQRNAYRHGHAWPLWDQPVAIGEYCRKGFARCD